MITDLANIGKTIDGIIAGTVQFLYSIVSALFFVYSNPVRGSIRFYRAKSVSAATFLFIGCASVIAYISYGATALKTLLKAESPDLIVYVAVVVILYVVTDICAHVLSAWCAPRGRRRGRARDCLRYCLGAVLLGWVIAVPSIFFVDDKVVSPIYSAEGLFGNFFIILKILPFFLAFLAYPLLLGLFFFGRRYRGGGPTGMLGVGVLSACVILVILATLQAPVSGYVSAAVTSEKADPERAMVVAGFACREDVGHSVLEISAVIYNPTGTPAVIGNGSVGVQIGPIDESEDSPAWVYLPEFGQPLAAISPGGFTTLASRHLIDSAIEAALRRGTTCLVDYANAQDPTYEQAIEGASQR